MSSLASVAGCRRAPTTPVRPALRVELASEGLPSVRAELERAIRKHAETRGYEVDLTFASADELPQRHPPGSRTLPDVALAGALGPARLFWGRSLLDVTDAVEKLMRRNGGIPSSFRRALTFEKRLWAIPFYTCGWAWLLRQDLLEAKGLAPPSTLAETLSAAVRLTDPGQRLAGWALPLLRSSEGETLVHQVILGFGGALADEQGRRVVLASPETVEAVGFLAGILRNPDLRRSLPSDPRDWLAPTREAGFLAGRIAMAPVSAELYSRIVRERSFPRKALRALSPPAGPKRRATTAEGYLFVVSRETRHPELCLDLIGELLSPGRLGQLILETDGAVVPAYANLTHHPFWDGDPLREVFATNARGDPSRQLEFAEFGYPGPVSSGAAEVHARLVLGEALARCAEDGISPETAVREAHRRAERIYDDVNRTMAAFRRGDRR